MSDHGYRCPTLPRRRSGNPGGWVRWPIWRVAVAERSMQPALNPGDWLLLRRTTRAGRTLRIRAGQVVLARHPWRPEMLLFKRVARQERAGWSLSSDNPGAGVVD